MRLKNKRGSVPGGRRYEYAMLDGSKKTVTGNSVNWEGFVHKVELQMRLDKVPVPENLDEEIQDWMCMQIPESYCWYSQKIGDQLSKGIHAGAKLADKAFGALGIKTNLTKKARTCSTCGSRRRRLNK